MLILKEILRKLITEESQVQKIEVKADNLEEAINKASEKLGVGINNIDYEIISFGSKGVLGVGKKDYIIKAYIAKAKDEILESIMINVEEPVMQQEFASLDVEEKVIDKDSDVFVRVTTKGVMLKVTPKIGRGKRINEKKVYTAITARGFNDYNKDTVDKIIREAKGEYCRIGEMPINVANDSTASVQVSSDEMKAYLIISPPRPGGFDLDADEIKSILSNNGVVVGIKEDILKKIIDYPVYNESVLIAEGKKVINGKDAEIHFNFNVNKDEIHLMEEDGKVNFKELNIVQNVVAGQILATKELQTEGEPGRTVTNKLLTAKAGKDCQMYPGRNTKLTEDGLNIVAEINGQVYVMGNKIVVDPVYIIQGDVNLKTGNILFLGTVVIQGGIEDGFSVKAAGNIEIHGSVGRCELDAEGDIMINGGVMGKNEGIINSGKSVYAKFIESVKVNAIEGVYVQDGILHSFIDATKEIVCIGKRGAIVGGKLRAGELIKTKTLGSVANPETIIEVGVDPKKRQILEEFTQKRDKAYKELEPIKANLENLINQKKAMKNLTEEKENLLKELTDKVNEIKAVIKEANEEIKAVEVYLAELKSKGKIIASKIAYPNVKLYIKDASLVLKNEYKKVAFVLQAGEINTQLYKEEEDRK